MSPTPRTLLDKDVHHDDEPVLSAPPSPDSSVEAPIEKKDSAIRAVSRALELLRVMNRGRRWSLHELHQETRLPKPTLYRLLYTLQNDGYVTSDVIRHEYSLTRRVLELSQGYSEPSRLVAAAASVTRDFTRRTHWPLALGILEGEHLVVAQSTMPYSPLAIRTSTLGQRLSWTNSAMARIYLAFQTADSLQALLDAISAQQESAHNRLAFEHELRALRSAGFAVRHAVLRQDSATLAVPVLENGRAVAALGMTTFAGSMTPELVESILPLLKESAELIVTNHLRSMGH